MSRVVRLLHRGRNSARTAHVRPALTRQYASRSTKVIAHALPVPLGEREGKFIASAGELYAWNSWARQHAETVSSQLHLDADLPSMSSLFTEVDWILEDAVAGVRKCPKDDEWRAFGRMSHRREFPDHHQVLLRENLDDLRKLWALRLSNRVPLQYLTATCHWRDLVLVVAPGVLIPRPETERMVDFVAGALDRSPNLAHIPWVDLGTGSGSLAISIAMELETIRKQGPNASSSEIDQVLVHAVDLSPTAVKIARLNVQRNFTEDATGLVHVRVHEGSWYEPLEMNALGRARVDNQEYIGTFGGIVSNPPYIPSEDMRGLQPEVRLHEPWLALDGGSNQALDSFTSICSGAVAHLVPGGFLLLETNGEAQSQAVAKMLQDVRKPDQKQGSSNSEGRVFENIDVSSDYCGVRRFVSAWKVLQ